jgi:hypothetical protein
MSTKKWFALMVIAVFTSVISFFQINSYWADKNNFNGFFGWLGIGIVFGIAAIYCLSKVSKAGSSNDSGN